MKVVIGLNTAWNLVNFRAGLIRALVANGYEVVTVAPSDDYASRLTELGCRFVALPMDNKGTHPGRDLLLFFRFLKLLRNERPDVFLGYTIKPNIFGSLAAHMLGIPVINNIAGLGAVFMRDNWLTRLVRRLYKLALSRSCHVFFQNNEDLQMFVEQGLVTVNKVSRLPGSGIDLVKFPYTPMQSSKNQTFCFLLVARLLWDKGVGEYVEAARILRSTYPDIKFQLLGFLDVKNPSAVSSEQMADWVKEGVVEYLGVSDDVKHYMVAADCVVLPSYREGVPRSLLEAAAIGRPIVTTDVTGCRDAVDDGLNGMLCKVRDPLDLAEKMLEMIQKTPLERYSMGAAGRLKMESEFDERFVIDKYLQVIQEIR
ncbi:MAG: glycosyltransferase family 4 protein [Methylotenera sp.]|uniref:glycosyltransferase family 4 protein n=1 Tax=Methylotenera sp. TaxID=2051956 RepID=UPI00184C1914|nr:glycosyltransferase family 4 protein [Methylotenera sp.]NOU25895.1 glycosyltransferase family 4 protein [Methylotenera sp.]